VMAAMVLAETGFVVEGIVACLAVVIIILVMVLLGCLGMYLFGLTPPLTLRGLIFVVCLCAVIFGAIVQLLNFRGGLE